MSTLLDPNEAASLVKLLSMTQTPLREVTRHFDETFRSDVHTRVALAIRIMLLDGFFTVPTSLTASALGVVSTRDGELLIALLLLVHLHEAGHAPASGPALREFLLALEDHLRRDAIRRKRENATAKRSLKDAIEQDAYRIRSAVKLYVLYCLSSNGIARAENVASTSFAWLQLNLDVIERGYDTLNKGKEETGGKVPEVDISKFLSALEEETTLEQNKPHLLQFPLCTSCPSTLTIQSEGVCPHHKSWSNPGTSSHELTLTRAERLDPQFSRPAPQMSVMSSPGVVQSSSNTLSGSSSLSKYASSSESARFINGDLVPSASSVHATTVQQFGWGMQFTLGEFPLVLLS